MPNPPSKFLIDLISDAEECHRAGRQAEAISRYRCILETNPELSRTAYNLGMLLNESGDYAAAESCFMQTLRREPELFEARLNLLFAIQEQGRITEAADGLRALLLSCPVSPDARFNLACLRLLTGDLPAAWIDYELRFSTTHPVPRRHLSLKRWDGTFSPGMRLLLHSEQGYGDTIQMLRYIPPLINRGMKVWVETTPPLHAFINRINGLCGCICRGDTLPDADVQLPLMSLPLVMQTTLDTIPENPEIVLDPELLRFQGSCLAQSKGMRVGLCWAGKLDLPVNRKRTCPPEYLTRLFEVPGISFVSLQTGHQEDFAVSHPNLLDTTHLFRNFSDTAALIKNLDLVITIDTAVAHLSGLLGKPTWLLLPHVPDWRWLLDRDDSPWYPSMRLIRQPSPGDWTTPLDIVLTDLRKINKPAFYVYRSDRDFTAPQNLGMRPVPIMDILSGPEAPKSGAYITDNPSEADFFLFPYYLEHLTEHNSIEGMWDFISGLPRFSSDESRHVFFSDHDSPPPYHTPSVWFRASFIRSRHDPCCYPLPYYVEDLSSHLHFDSRHLKFHASFVGFPGVRKQRAAFLNGVIAEKRLVSHIEYSDAFHGHQPEQVRIARREHYLNISSQSIAMLCPPGDGTSSMRLFEAMSLGRLPVVPSGCPLPHEDRIDYERFLLKVPPETSHMAGTLIHEWLDSLSGPELINRMRESRNTWELWFSAASSAEALLGVLQRHMAHPAFRQGNMPEPPEMKDRTDGPSLLNLPDLLSSGDAERAQQAISAAIRENPRNPRYYLLLGLFMKHAGDIDTAEAAFTDAILYDHRFHEAHLELGHLYASAGRYQDAAERYYEASLIRPEDSTSYESAIPVLERLGRHEERLFCIATLKSISGTAAKA